MLTITITASPHASEHIPERGDYAAWSSPGIVDT
jgi:hypothetical protein